MKNPPALSRRDFLQNSTRLALGAAFAASPDRGLAATPKRRNWLVACRDAHLKETGLPDCWAAMKFLGVDGAEVDINDVMECYSLSAFCMHNRLDERLEMELEWTRRVVNACVQLGVGVIRIDVVPRKIQPQEFLPFAIRACKRLCETAEGTPVRFGIENHGKITNDPEFLDRLFDGVGSPRLGLTLDFLNFYWFGHPLESLYGIYEKFAPRAVHTHCKNVRYPDDQRNARRPMGWEYAKYSAPVYAGDIDYKRCAAILRKAGYAGDLCLENECVRKFPEQERPRVLKKEIALLRSVV